MALCEVKGKIKLFEIPFTVMRLDQVVKIGVIIACGIMFCYTMIYFPWQCHQITILSGGMASCGLNVGAYILAIVMCLTATVAALMLIE